MVGVRFWFGLLLSCLGCCSQAADIQFNTLGHKDGLAANIVLSVTQDATGFMWIGTSEGLNRFDGRELITYRHDPDDPHSIPANRISKVFIDSQNRLWLACLGGGLSRYRPHSDDFVHIQHDDTRQDSLSSDNIYDIVEDQQGSIWIVTYLGVDKLNPDTGQVERKLSFQYSKYLHAYSSLYIDDLNRLWVASFNNGLYLYDINSEQTLQHLTHANGAISDQVTDVAFIDGRYWVTTFDAGLMLIDPDTFAVEVLTQENSALPSNYFVFVAQDSKGQVWLGSENKGLLQFDLGLQAQKVYTYEKGRESGFPSHEAITFFEDSSGTHWIGTYQGGVTYFHNQDNGFRQFNTANSKLTKSSVLPVIEDASGNIWFGTDGGGLYQYQVAQNNMFHYQAGAVDDQGLSSNVVLSLAQTSDQAIWIGTYKQGLNRLDHKTGSIQRFNISHPEHEILAKGNIWNIVEDHDGWLWLATDAGLLQFDVAQQQVVASWLDDESIRGVYQDNKQRLWVGTFTGLYLMDKSSKPWQLVKQYSSQPNSDLPQIGSGGVIDIYQDSQDRIWLGNYGGGLDWIDHDTRQVINFNERHHFSSNIVSRILEDALGFLWVATSNGLVKISPDLSESASFNNANGLNASFFNVNAGVKSRDGLFYFGSIEGLNYFDPVNLTYNQMKPPVVLTKLNIFNAPVTTYDENSPIDRHISYADHVTLNHQQSVFSFEFAALNFVHANRNRYAYRLEGFDQDWVQIGHKNEAVYTNLDAGRYVFRVIASNNDGVWNEQGRQISITIIPPWWETFWFRAAFLLVIVLSAYLYYKSRIYLIQEQKLALEKEVSIRTSEIEQQKQSIEQALNNLQETQSQLVQAEKMSSLGTLTAGIAHELNNPANFANGGAQILTEELKAFQQFLIYLGGDDPDPEIVSQINQYVEQLNKHIETIREGTSRISHIVKDLRVFTRTSQSEKETLAIGSLLSATVNLVKTRFDSSIQIELSIIDDPSIACHPSELNQVFMNLIVNACQAIEARQQAEQNLDGRLQIRCKQQESLLVIQFKDNGIGMSQQTLQRIYEPFFTTKSVGQGTGLGLSISFKIIENHTGQVDVSSQPNDGACFILKLPIVVSR